MRSVALMALALQLGLGCTTPQTPSPAGPPPTKAEPQPADNGAAQPAAAAPAAAPAQAPTFDLSGVVIQTMAVKDLDTVLNQGLSYIKPHVPPALSAMLQPALLKQQLFKSLRVKDLDTALDSSRPWAAAMTDPNRYRGLGLGPLVMAMPIVSDSALLDVMEKASQGHDRTEWGDHEFNMGPRTVRVRLTDGYALLAANQELLNGARDVLMPLVQRQAKSSAAAVLHIELANINRLYGSKMDRAISRMQRRASRKGPQAAGVTKMLARWMGYLRSMNAARIELELDPREVRLTGVMTAAQSGSFPDYLRSLKPQPVWGMRYMPADAGLVLFSHQSPDGLLESIDEGMAILRPAVKGIVPEATLTRLRDLSRHSVKHLQGSSATALWVNADGGLGFGSATRVRDAAAARKATVELLSLVGSELRRLLTKGLPAEARKQLKGFSVGLKVRKGALRLGKLRGDLVQLDLRWPRLKDRAKRKKLAEVKKKLRKVLGPRIAFGLVTVDDALLLAGGKGFRKRLATMATGKSSALSQTMARLTGGRAVVGASHVPLAALAEQVMRITEQLTKVPAKAKVVFQKLLPPPGKTVPVNAVLTTEGRELKLVITADPELFGIMTRAGVAFFTASMRGGATVTPTP